MQGKVTDGKTIDRVAPTGGVVAGELYRIDGWNGICETAAAETATFAMNVDPVPMFWIKVPGGVSAPSGTILYMPTATGGVGSVSLTATSTSNVAAVKVIVAKDSNYIVGGKILNIS